jgi:hypothetical protein
MSENCKKWLENLRKRRSKPNENTATSASDLPHIWQPGVASLVETKLPFSYTGGMVQLVRSEY